MPPMVTLLFGEHSVTPHGTWDTLGFSKPHLTASEEVTQTPFNNPSLATCYSPPKSGLLKELFLG